MCLSPPLSFHSFRLPNLRSSSLSEPVFMLLSEFFLVSPRLFSNRSHSAAKSKKSTEQRNILHIFQARFFTHFDMLLMQQDVGNPDSLCVAPSSHILFPSQCYPPTPVSLCFAEITLSSNPVLQLSEELQIVCCLQNIDLLSRRGDRSYLLHFDTKLLRATQIFLLTSSIPTRGSSIKTKFPLLVLKACNPSTEVHYSQEISHLLLSYP